MNHAVQRRGLLRYAGAVSMTALGLPAAWASTAAHASDAKTLADAIAALGAPPMSNPAITLDVPGLAEDGAFVPVSLSSALADARELLVLVDVNPQPLALQFTVPAGTEPYVATRIRMADSGTVVAAVRLGDGTLHAVARRVQVVLGGCG